MKKRLLFAFVAFDVLHEVHFPEVKFIHTLPKEGKTIHQASSFNAKGPRILCDRHILNLELEQRFDPICNGR
jgi:hypothetical protein